MSRKACRLLGITLSVFVAACGQPVPHERTHVRIAGGPRDATFYILARALASLYGQRIVDVDAEGLETRGTNDNIDAVETGRAECGLGSADLVYNAYLRGNIREPRPHQRLRGVAVLFPNVLHIVTRADSGYEALGDLSGKVLAAARPGDVIPERQDLRMEAVGVAIAALAREHVGPRATAIGMEEAVDALEAHRIDAASFYGGYPFRPVTSSAQRFGVHILPFDEFAASLVKGKYPFLKPIVIPAGTYPGQAMEIRTVAVDNVLICRADLPAELVYKLTLTLYSGLPDIRSVHASAQQINPENGASTPIPLHDGAARYYRERELFR
jgi:uncharacterized protein